MATTMSQADARAVERAARGVPGVAFAEVSSQEGTPPELRLWLWEGASGEETAGRVEVALREMGVEVATGDVRIAGIAKALAHDAHGEPGAVRVIDLGEGIWATEPVDPDVPPLLPPPEEGEPLAERAPAAPPARGVPGLTSVSVTRGGGTCLARVEVRRTDGTSFAAEARGPDSAARARRTVAEAAAAAAAAALGGIALDVVHAWPAETGPACALVVLCVAGSGAEGGEERRAAGAALIAEDPWRAFAIAALRAAIALS